MISIEKEVRVTIDGEDVDVLKEVCNLAKIEVDRCPPPSKWDDKEYYRIKTFLDRIFDI